MARLNKNRITATSDKDFVVFLIGMRINNWFAIHRWLPVISHYFRRVQRSPDVVRHRVALSHGKKFTKIRKTKPSDYSEGLLNGSLVNDWILSTP